MALFKPKKNVYSDSLFFCSLQVPDGFISHFYAISEHVSPVLAFGFLGPRQHLSEVCTIFKVRPYRVYGLKIFQCKQTLSSVQENH